MDERPYMSGSKCSTSATPFGAWSGVRDESEIDHRGPARRSVINSRGGRAFLHGKFVHRWFDYADAISATYVNGRRVTVQSDS